MKYKIFMKLMMRLSTSLFEPVLFKTIEVFVDFDLQRLREWPENKQGIHNPRLDKCTVEY